MLKLILFSFYWTYSSQCLMWAKDSIFIFNGFSWVYMHNTMLILVQSKLYSHDFFLGICFYNHTEIDGLIEYELEGTLGALCIQQFYRWGNRFPERWRDLFKISQLISDSARKRIWFSRSPMCCSCLSIFMF